MRKKRPRGTSDPSLPEEDKGTSFQVSDEVKLEVDLLKSAARDTRRSPSQDGKRGLSILVVDDDPEMRAYVKRCLGDVECEVGRIHEAGDGQEAFARARDTRVDLVISDVVMPRMDGFALCRALRSDGALRHIPVLLLTGEISEREVQSQARKVQAQGVLTKPFNARKLCDRVMQVIGREPFP